VAVKQPRVVRSRNLFSPRKAALSLVNCVARSDDSVWVRSPVGVGQIDAKVVKHFTQHRWLLRMHESVLLRDTQRSDYYRPWVLTNAPRCAHSAVGDTLFNSLVRGRHLLCLTRYERTQD
jgi:hypothetical protein